MNLKLEKLLTAGFAAVLGASFIAATPTKAFWGGEVAQQKKMILGTWDCTYETGGKIYRADFNQFSFRRDGTLKTDLRGGSGQLQLIGTWKINKASELVFPAGAPVK